MNVPRAPLSLSGLDDRDMTEVVVQAARFADALRGARLLITGATGWFGTWLLDALVALDRAHGLGLSIVAVSREPAAFAKKHPSLYAAPIISWHEADVRDSLIDLPGPFTHIVHAATEANARINAEEPDRMFETIIGGTTNVLKLAACHPQVRLLLVSSGAVYGAQPRTLERLDEDYPGSPDVLDPANAYAEGKRAAELLASIWHARHDVHVTIARCFAFVGPHMPFDAHFAVGNFIRDALAGKTILIDGDGTPRRSYLYMTDLMIWLLAILVDGVPIRPYNVGGEEIVTIAELARRCIAAVARNGDYRVEARASGSRDYVPSLQRVKGELGVEATLSLDEALVRTVAWKRAIVAREPA